MKSSFPFFIISLLGFFLDLGSKKWMRTHRAGKVVENRGFAGNMLDGKPAAVAAVSVVMTAAVGAAAFRVKGTGTGALLSRLGLSTILGGAAANTFERVAKRRVTDFIHLGKYYYNPADFLIYAGCALWMAGEVVNESVSPDL